MEDGVCQRLVRSLRAKAKLAKVTEFLAMEMLKKTDQVQISLVLGLDLVPHLIRVNANLNIWWSRQLQVQKLLPKMERHSK
jgi:hypothetical protein